MYVYIKNHKHTNIYIYLNNMHVYICGKYVFICTNIGSLRYT